MNIVFISPHFPPNFYQFCEQLHKKGCRVLGIDQVHRNELNTSLRNSLTDYYQVENLHHYERLVQACDYFIQRYGAIDRIESHNEYWLETQANLATHFHIPGIKNHQIAAMKRKSEMKKIFRLAGMKPAKGDLVPTLEAALTLANELGYPLMLKPDKGVGASGCVKMHHDDELRSFFYHTPDRDYLMEEFIVGDVCTYDGLADREGAIIFKTSHVYNKGIAEIVSHQLDPYYYSFREIPSDLEHIGQKTVEAFGVKERFFHFEYFRTHKDGSLIPIEVNIRPPGGPSLDMCNYACDINLYEMWAEIIAGEQKQYSIDRKYHSIAISRRNKNSYLHPHDQVLATWNQWIVHHQPVPALYTHAMGDYCYIARSPNLENILNLQSFIQKQHT